MKDKLFKNSFIFILGDFLNKAIPFLMLPILTRYLTPADYGIISIFGVTVSMLAIFAGLSIHGAINVNFFTLNKESLKVYIGNTIIILNISTLIVFLLVFLFSSYISFKINLPKEWLFVAVVLAFSQFLTTINLVLWIAEKRPKLYSIYQISQTILTTLLSIMMIVGLGLGWQGQLIAIAIGTIIFSIISFIFIVKRGYFIFKPNKLYIEDALKFGIPLIPHALSFWIKTGADKIFLMYMLGSAVVGTYSVSYQVGMVIGVLVAAFNKAWTPYFMNMLSSNPTKEEKLKLVKFTYTYNIFIFILAIIFSYIANLAIPFFLGSKFVESSQYIIYFSLSFAFEGMYFMVTNYLFYVKKTYILAYVTFSISLVHIFTLYILITLNGEIGAAQTMLITSLITFISVWFLSQKVYPMPWLFWKK